MAHKALKVGLVFGGIYASFLVINFYRQRDKGVQRAIALCGSKGIINIGSGCDWSASAMSFCQLPQIKVNLDIHVADDCPKCQQADFEDASLPFADKQFDVALSSHSLEHVSNWEAALTEWSRIADHLVIVLPSPFSINSYFNPLHKQHFSFADMDYIRQHWNAEVFA